MKNLDCVKLIFILGVILMSQNAFSDNKIASVRINNYVIPAVFVSALNQGMNVPVYIRYKGDTTSARSEQKIADVVLSIKEGSFHINQVILDEQPQRTELSPALKSRLIELKDVSFGDGSRLDVTKEAFLSLEAKSFYIELNVSQDALAAAIIPRTNTLGDSSIEGVTSVLNYTFGSYYNKLKNSDNSSSYITLNNTMAWREHHVNLNGSIYGIGTPYSNGELYRAMYERDHDGHRLAVGMVDTWNLQSIASMSALNSSRIYGASFGYRSSTQIEDNTLSLLPVTVFLPAAGEVHIYRDNKLLSIQNFPMGSYEIDTSRLPFGVYNVDVQVVVNGRVVSNRNAQINKTFSRRSSITGDLSWQIFGGTLEYNKRDYRHRQNISYGKKDTWISGVAVATTQPWFSGVNLKSTLYGFDNNGVNETEANFIFSDKFTVNQQVLLATDSSWRSISTLNLSLPQGYGSLWTTREKSYIGDRLGMQKGEAFSVGATANLNKISAYLGSLTLSTTNDRTAGNKYTNVDYNQSLFSNRHATVSLRTGIQHYTYDDRNTSRDKYINIDVSIPLSTWFSAGVSSENGNMLANATARKSISDSAITQVGGSLSKRISQKDDSSHQTNDFAANGYAAFDTKYNTGNVSVTHTSDRSSTFNMSSQGSVGWAKDGIAMGKGSQSSGVMIKTDFNDTGTMLANINGRNYPISGKNNYISLPAYAEYKIELMNDKNSEDSVSVVNGRQNQIVLYPGNVGVINPEIKQLVTVFGRIKSEDGTPFANMDIQNHIGKTRTDDQGEFSMDIDKRYAFITMTNQDNNLCEVELDLREARGAIWLGDLTCQVQKKYALRRNK
ncbi:TcfC E-set like domain-containing protein [Winslowiella sp. 2C04]|uniref:TcfC E-set like domain-containing protein n=1 Tax=Winslowiella sp. 2C04 TaxID=3416179 RepID=UPI003CFA95AE